jgi:diguanylate cyclase (GGDEF)-like protein
MKAPDFAAASKEALAFLHARLGLGLWMVTRADEDDWIVLSAVDHIYGIDELIANGIVFHWADTLCARMARGDGPRIAPRVADVPAYAGAPLARKLRIGAYVGVPLTDGDGKLFGTLCGFDPEPRPESLVEHERLVEVIADMLSGLLRAELQANSLAREVEAARGEALVDPLTGLSNRRAWERALAAEEERCRRYGAPACVIVVEFDSPEAEGEIEDEDLLRAQRVALLLRGAQALRHTVRKPDTLARLDDATFVVLGVECTNAEAMSLLRRLDLGLKEAGVSAALGMAMRARSERLSEAWKRAADAMEEHRQARAARRMGHEETASAAATPAGTPEDTPLERRASMHERASDAVIEGDEAAGADAAARDEPAFKAVP